MSLETAQPKSELFLDEVELGLTGTFVVMVCRMWDVNAVTGCYLSTDFVLSDAKTGSRTLNFYLANCRGPSVRVTLWGGLGEMLIEKRTHHVGLGVEFSKENLLVDYTDAKAGTLENLLMWARNRNTTLELEVFDDTTEVVVVMFDETTSSLVKCSADSILESEDQHPSVATPSKPAEEKKRKRVDLKDSDAELSLIAATQTKSGEGGCPSDKRKTKDALSMTLARNRHPRVHLEDSDIDVSFVAATHAKSGEGGCPFDKRKQKVISKEDLFKSNEEILKTQQEILKTQQEAMNTGKKPTENHSLANILHNSVMIHSNTIVRRDRKVKSYCGLKLTGIATSTRGTSSVRDKARTNLKQKAIASTSNCPFSQSDRRKTEPTQMPKSKKVPKGAA
nr:replication factor A protein 1-like isoform X1 [Tanacetum cinerariifolium]